MSAPPLAVTFANLKYLPVLLNWILFLPQEQLARLRIYSLDKDLYHFLSERGFPTRLRPQTGPKNKLWQLRTKVFNDLIHEGQDFLHSDTDAVWLRDPHSILREADADLTLSQGTIWPHDVVLNQKFVGCCGFFLARSNPKTQVFFRALSEHTANTGDDQVSLNRLLKDFAVSWQTSDTEQYSLSHDELPFTCFETTIKGTAAAHGLTVALLPHRAFQRQPMSAETVYVKHPLSTDPSKTIEQTLDAEGCWRLRHDWGKVDFDFSSIESLAQPEKMQPAPTNTPIITGNSGGAWTADTHKTLYPNNFNNGLATFIANQFMPQSVLEFGSGLGEMASFLAKNTRATTVDCIEPLIMPDSALANQNLRQFTTDIFTTSLPIELKKTYDLVLSIEVAEHIERWLHPKLFDFLASRAANWLIFSGARIGQGGHGHVAERPEHEWCHELISRGLIFREDLTKAARTACDQKNINHRRNVMVFQTSNSAPQRSL